MGAMVGKEFVGKAVGEEFVSEIVGKTLDEVYGDPVDGVVGVEEVVGEEAMG